MNCDYSMLASCFLHFGDMLASNSHSSPAIGSDRRIQPFHPVYLRDALRGIGERVAAFSMRTAGVGTFPSSIEA